LAAAGGAAGLSEVAGFSAAGAALSVFAAIGSAGFGAVLAASPEGAAFARSGVLTSAGFSPCGVGFFGVSSAMESLPVLTGLG
jgi:hypothetical protein